MAKQLNYTTADWVEHPASYWKVRQVTLIPVDQAASVTFYGYHSQAARLSGAEHIGEKVYSLHGPEYETFFGMAVLSEEGKNPFGQAYALAEAQDQFGFWDDAEDV